MTLRALRLFPVLLLLPLAFTAACKKGGSSESSDPKSGGSAATADPGIALTGETPAGTKLTFSRSMEWLDAHLIQKLGDKAIEGTIDTTESQTETVTFIDPLSRSITYAGGISRRKMQAAGIPPLDQEEAHPLTGQTIAARLSNGAWDYTSAGIMPPEQKAKLQARRELDEGIELLFPEKSYEVGDQWDIGPEAIAALVAGDATIAEGSGTVNFEAVEDYAGQRCALLNVTVQATGIDDTGGSVNLDLKGSMRRSLSLFQNLSLDLSGTMKMQRSLEGNGSVDASGPLTISIKAE